MSMQMTESFFLSADAKVQESSYGGSGKAKRKEKGLQQGSVLLSCFYIQHHIEMWAIMMAAVGISPAVL